MFLLHHVISSLHACVHGYISPRYNTLYRLYMLVSLDIYVPDTTRYIVSIHACILGYICPQYNTLYRLYMTVSLAMYVPDTIIIIIKRLLLLLLLLKAVQG